MCDKMSIFPVNYLSILDGLSVGLAEQKRISKSVTIILTTHFMPPHLLLQSPTAYSHPYHDHKAIVVQSTHA